VYLLAFHAYCLLCIFIFKGLTERRLYKSFGVKGVKERQDGGFNIVSTATTFLNQRCTTCEELLAIFMHCDALEFTFMEAK
jgi:hypothetical protein